MFFEAPHLLVTVVRSALIINALHKDYGFIYGKTDEQTMQEIVSLVKGRKMKNHQIINKILMDHTLVVGSL